MITKTHSGLLQVGQRVTFMLTVQNMGTMPTTGSIVITDPLPNGLTLLSVVEADWSCTPAPMLVCTYLGPPLAPGAAPLTLTLVTRVDSAWTNHVINIATVSTEGDIDSSNNTSQTIVFRTGVIAPVVSAKGLALMIAAMFGVAWLSLRRVWRTPAR